MNSMDALLRVVSGSLAEIRTRRTLGRLVQAPEFSPFEYIQADENRLSRIVADLLDPRGAHGQGAAFLTEFLRAVGLTNLAGLERARVELESQAIAMRARRRVDIVVRTDDWIVGVENKPWAADQINQVTDYLEELRRRRAAAYHLLYLTTNGARPSEQSISAPECNAAIECGILRIVSYETVAEWLHACVEVCRAPRVTWFLLMLCEHVERGVLGKLPPLWSRK